MGNNQKTVERQGEKGELVITARLKIPKHDYGRLLSLVGHNEAQAWKVMSEYLEGLFDVINPESGGYYGAMVAEIARNAALANERKATKAA